MVSGREGSSSVQEAGGVLIGVIFFKLMDRKEDFAKKLNESSSQKVDELKRDCGDMYLSLL